MDKTTLKHYYEAYADMIYRLGFTYMKNKTDAEDVVQDVFLKLVNQNRTFESDEHVKAWLIVTTSNHCKSLLTNWWNKRVEIEDEEIITDSPEEAAQNKAVLEAVMNLPTDLKTTIYLYYYEGYSSVEIAKILGKPAGTIRSRLHDGRLLLKDYLQEGAIAL